MASSFLENVADVKSEHVTTGLDAVSNTVEEDIYEDAGDLDFQDASQAIFLTRLPKFVWKDWLQLADDVEMQVGTVRVEGPLEKPQRMSLMLSEIPLNDMLPREYNMQITNRESTNTFVFTEHDLPGFSQRGRVVNNSGGATSQPFSQAAPRVPFSNRSKLGLASKVEKSWKRGSNFRKGIPKKTALVGHVRTELNCLPVENEQYRHIMDERARAELKPKRETQYLGKGTAGGNSLNPGTLGQSGSFDNFIKPTGNQRTKGQDSKAARMPQNELLDLIYECFKKYNYWPLKSLKNELNQPEAYLKQTLEMVGELVRQGPHAMTWKLRADSKPSDFAELQSFDQARDQAPDTNATYDGASSHGDMASEDEDGNVKMEDVMA